MLLWCLLDLTLNCAVQRSAIALNCMAHSLTELCRRFWRTSTDVPFREHVLCCGDRLKPEKYMQWVFMVSAAALFVPVLYHRTTNEETDSLNKDAPGADSCLWITDSSARTTAGLLSIC
jgi:hypothetical protein